MSAVPSPLALPAGCHADHPQVLVGAARRVDAGRQPADRLDALVVRVDGLAYLRRAFVVSGVPSPWPSSAGTDSHSAQAEPSSVTSMWPAGAARCR